MSNFKAVMTNAAGTVQRPVNLTIPTLTATNAFITNLTATNLTNVQTVNVNVTSVSADASAFLITATNSPSARTLADRFGEVLNIKDFGAKGDGITDDAPAIRAAITKALTLSAANIYFPLGTYKISSFDLTTINANYERVNGLAYISPRYRVQSLFYIDYRNYNANANPLRKISFIGDNATLTSGLWASGNYTYGAWDAIRFPLKIEGGGGTGAYAVARTNIGGTITQIVGLTGGSGYTSIPTVTFDSEKNFDVVTGQSQIFGSGATFSASIDTSTGTVSAINITNAGNYYAPGNCTLYWFNISAPIEASFEGLKCVSTFGGPGERPIKFDYNYPAATRTKPKDTLMRSYTSMGGVKFLAYYGGLAYNPLITWRDNPLNKNLTVQNCEFHDFVICLDVGICKELLVNSNKFFWTYGVASAGGRVDWYAAVGGPRYAAKSFIFTNNLADGCSVMDLRPLLDQYKTEYFDRAVCPDNVLIVPSADSVIASNNVMKHMGYEHIGPVLAIDDGFSPSQTIISNNNIDGTLPLGTDETEAGANYGIVVGATGNVLIDGNHIKNSANSILINPAGATNPTLSSNKRSDNIVISNNILLRDYRPQTTNTSLTSQPYYIMVGVTGGKPVVITNNLFNFENYPDFGEDWDGQSTTFNIQSTTKPSATWNPSLSARRNYARCLSLGGSNATEAFVANNTFVCKNKDNPDQWSMAIDSDSKNIFKNNTFKGFDFIISRQGGGGGPAWFEDTAFDGVRYIAGGNPDISFDKQIFSFYPPITGWYQVSSNARRNGSVDIQIQTNGEILYGDTFNGGLNTFFANQDTRLQYAYAGFFYDPTSNINATQTYHVASSAYPITKASFQLSYGPYVYFYVNKLTEKLKLNITGSNGALAQGYVNVDSGKLTTVVVTSGGNGLFDTITNPPIITVANGVNSSQESINRWQIRGKGGAFSSTVIDGIITDITVTSPGSGYQQPIYIQFQDKSYNYGVGKGLNGSYTVVDILSTTPIDENDLNIVTLQFKPGYKNITQIGYNPVNTVQRFGTGTPTISSNGGTLNVKPEFIGQEFLDTSNNKWYKAKGISSSADWLILN